MKSLIWSESSCLSPCLMTYKNFYYNWLILACIVLKRCAPGSLIPRPSHCPVFDHIQYVEMEGRSLEVFVTLVTSRGSDWNNDFESFFSVSLQVLEFQTFMKWKSCHSLFRMENTHSKVHCFSWTIGKIICVLRFEHQTLLLHRRDLVDKMSWSSAHLYRNLL